MTLDPDQRITPEEALRHPWIANSETKSKLKHNDEIVEAVMNSGPYSNKNKGMNRVASTSLLGTQFLAVDETKMTWDDVR